MSESDQVSWLMRPQAVRAQANAIYELGLANQLDHFTVHPARLAEVANFVAETIRQNYPALQVPPHARWRHFVIDGKNRWARYEAGLTNKSEELARQECELAIVSVLLDAGAGASWSYLDKTTGRHIARSEGLAIASLDMYQIGLFSKDQAEPRCVDAERLMKLTSDNLAAAFQVSTNNPLEGLEGRVLLLKNLGEAIAQARDVFPTGRLGSIADRLKQIGHSGELAADEIVKLILKTFGSIWPGRTTLDGQNLGDTWHYAKLPSPHLIPFHKLSQWLSYSLFEPMQKLGLTITQQDQMTGLAEYRNGGLFLDFEAIQLRDHNAISTAHQPGDELIVEWRALTIAMLDRVAPLVREKLGLTEEALPLAAVLEGGTWAAGRRIAKQKRSDGGPPLNIASDGSVF